MSTLDNVYSWTAQYDKNIKGSPKPSFMITEINYRKNAGHFFKFLGIFTKSRLILVKGQKIIETKNPKKPA